MPRRHACDMNTASEVETCLVVRACLGIGGARFAKPVSLLRAIIRIERSRAIARRVAISSAASRRQKSPQMTTAPSLSSIPAAGSVRHMVATCLHTLSDESSHLLRYFKSRYQGAGIFAAIFMPSMKTCQADTLIYHLTLQASMRRAGAPIDASAASSAQVLLINNYLAAK